jgi:preprotein translocase subunit YajC
MEISIGEYVRTNLGHIGKIIKEYTFKNGGVVYPEPQELVLDNKYVLNEAGMYQMGEQIVKHSKDIKDLLQIGDIITTNNLCGEITKIDRDTIYLANYMGTCNIEDIESIITQEQIKKIEFRIKE